MYIQVLKYKVSSIYKDGITIQLLFQQELCTPKPAVYKFSSTRVEVQDSVEKLGGPDQGGPDSMG